MPTLGRKFHGIADEVGDSLKQQVAVAAHRCIVAGYHAQGDVLLAS
jgi:hypothetical protein